MSKNYRASEAKAQKELDQWQEPSESFSLERELGLARFLLSEANQAKNYSLCRDLLKCISDLNRSHRVSMEAESRLLPREVIERMGQEVGRIVADELRESGLYDWPTVADRILSRIAETLTTKDKQPEPSQ